jgi:small subunit ribosomal protein S20
MVGVDGPRRPDYKRRALEGDPLPSRRLISRRKDPMANTSSAKKAARKIERRERINKGRRSRMRTALRKVEEAIAAGDRNNAVAAMKAAEPELMRAAQKGVVHRNAASRKISRLTHRIVQLGK